MTATDTLPLFSGLGSPGSARDPSGALSSPRWVRQAVCALKQVGVTIRNIYRVTSLTISGSKLLAILYPEILVE